MQGGKGSLGQIVKGLLCLTMKLYGSFGFLFVCQTLRDAKHLNQENDIDTH